MNEMPLNSVVQNTNNPINKKQILKAFSLPLLVGFIAIAVISFTKDSIGNLSYARSNKIAMVDVNHLIRQASESLAKPSLKSPNSERLNIKITAYQKNLVEALNQFGIS